MPEPAHPVRATAQVIGLVQGREIQAVAELSLGEHSLLLSWPHAAPWALDFDGLDGVRIREQEATLYLAGHDILELRGDEALRPVLRRLLDQLYRVPEVLRSARHFGALDAPPHLQVAHDHWFAPLLTARRALEGVSDPLRQVALSDADSMATGIRQRCEFLAARQEPAGGAPQRALAAQLEDDALEAITAVASMALAADTLRRGDDETRCADWRRWVAALVRVAHAFETGWLAVEQRLR